MELQYIDYNCLNKGKTWSLLGEYVPGEDYQFNQNVAIIDGKLRIYCATGGVLGQVLLKNSLVQTFYVLNFLLAIVPLGFDQ